MKFTKGPWLVGNELEESIGVKGFKKRYIPIYDSRSPHPDWACDEPGDSTHSIITGVYICNTEEALANAYLIATAPDMYEALEKLIKFTNELCNELCEDVGISTHYESLNGAVNVLKKARGE